MNRIVISKEEARYLARNIVKTLVIMEAASKKDAEIKERATYKTLKSLTEKIGEIAYVLETLKDEPYEFDLFLSQKQRTVLRGMVENTVKALNDTIIPEYSRRGAQDYLEDAKGKVSLLNGLQRKLK